MMVTARHVHDLSVRRWSPAHPVRIIGVHASLASTLAELQHIACSESPVLMTGEPGTGKNLFGRALHLLSPRSDKALVKIRCAQYEHDAPGLFDAANGGVVVLDEIGDLSLRAQTTLLRLIKEGETVASRQGAWACLRSRGRRDEPESAGASGSRSVSRRSLLPAE